ncbi:MAG: hypothetical protein CL872_05915 [Dehalococcoidaceae bacterium]|nr:hypothetical protein [Dehalococcoidaceae bacterium]
MNFNQEGFRGAEFSIEKSSDTFRVITLGGSTMVGAETTNDSTIPVILQKLIEKEKIGQKVEIINAGISGGNSSSEYSLIESKLKNYDPDLIIVYDGWNDISADYPVLLTKDYWKGMCDAGEYYGFDVIITLQPIAGFGDKMLTTQERINALTGQDHNGFQLIQGISTYDWYAKELKTIDTKQCKTFDLRGIFDDVLGSVYWDQGHTLHTGNLIVAEKFFEIIMGEVDPKYNVDKKFTKIISKYNTIPMLSYLLEKLDVDETTFDNPMKNTMEVGNKKGKYFQLKKEFLNISDILVGKDLRKTNLVEFDLSGKDLTGANLSGQDLRNVDLTNAIIRDANLSNTNLEGKNFSGMDLRGINFSYANMRDVDLTNAIISKGVQIYGDCLDNDQTLSLIKNFSCVSEQVAKNESIRTNFSNADLTNAKFGNSDMAQDVMFTDFSNAILNNIEIDKIKFSSSKFHNAEFNDVTAKAMVIVASDFDGVEMNNLVVETFWVHDVSIIDSTFTNGEIKYGFFYDVDLTNSDLEYTKIDNNEDFEMYKQEGFKNNFDCLNNTICN